MTKKDLIKTRLSIRAGYYHGSYCVFEVVKDVEKTINEGHPFMDTEVVARIGEKDLIDFISKRIRGGLFEVGEKGRKYQYITLK